MIVASSQFSFWLGDQIYFPYSIAVLVSYLNKDKRLKESFTYLKTAVDRDKVEEYIEENNPDILLCSCYTWNWTITSYFAKKMKEKNPNCIVICGGPQVPNDCVEFFEAHPYIDIAIHNEGERVLKNVFTNILDNKPVDELKSVSTKTHPEWQPEEIIKDLDELPSPYLDGTILDLVDESLGITWIAVWETTRGCPYACSFCAWGVSTYNSLRKFGLERLKAEIDWMADYKLDFLECADSNFGVFDRDVEITDYLTKTKHETSYPRGFRTCWAKKITPKVTYIARTLKNADLLAAVGCSLQSLDATTLKQNHRVSVSYDQFVEIIDDFKNAGAQCFTEIIRGLPGETLDTFKDGLNKIAFGSRVDSICIYNCALLESTALASKEKREEWKITSQISPLYFAHIVPSEDPHVEEQEIITSCYSFTEEDLLIMHLYSWYILAFQSFGILSFLTKYLKDEYEIPYNSIYDKLVEYCKGDTLLGREFKIAEKYIRDAYKGKGWTHVDENYGPITWAIDEASWLRITHDHDALKKDLAEFVETIFPIDDALQDLVDFQVNMLSNIKNTEKEVEFTNKYNWLSYFQGNSLTKGDITYTYENKLVGELPRAEWAKQAIWYGKRRVNYKTTLEELEIKKVSHI